MNKIYTCIFCLCFSLGLLTPHKIFASYFFHSEKFQEMNEERIQEILNRVYDPFEFPIKKLDNEVINALNYSKKRGLNELFVKLLIAKAYLDNYLLDKNTAANELNDAEQLISSLSNTKTNELYIQLASVYIKIGESKKGYEILEMVKFSSRGSVPNQVKDLTNVGDVYALLRNKPSFDGTYNKAENLAKEQGTDFQVILSRVQALFSMNENTEAIQRLQKLAQDTVLKSDEAIQVLSMLVINYVKLDKPTKATEYYKKLIQINVEADHTSNEYLLADGLYHKKNPTKAIQAFLKLAERLEKGQKNVYTLEGTIQLAALYSSLNKVLEAEKYFNLSAKTITKQLMTSPAGVLYYKLYQKFLKKLRNSDANSLADKSLPDSFLSTIQIATKDLEYRFRILQDSQQLKIASQQQQLNNLTHSRDKQQIWLIVLGITCVLVFAIAFIYVQKQKRMQEAMNYEAELKRIKQEHRAELMERLAKAQESERKMIADQLHDEIGSMLAVARLNLSSLQDENIIIQGQSFAKLNTTAKILADVATDVRQMSHSLMPLAIEHLGLKGAVEQLVSNIINAAKLNIEYIILGFDEDDFPDSFKVDVFRIINELFQNILKHAQATNVLFQMIKHPTLINIFIEDNGAGIKAELKKGEGKGLELLKSRVAYYEGEMTIDVGENGGIAIIINIPFSLNESIKNKELVEQY